MKNKKKGLELNSKNVFFVIAMICLLAFVYFYYNVYVKMQDDTEKLRSDNLALNARISSMETYYQNEKLNREQAEEYRQKIADVVEAFPSDLRPEDAIMTAVKVQDKAQITYDTISIAAPEVAYSVSSEDMAAAGMDEYPDTIEFVRENVIYNNALDYPSLKDAIAALFDNGYASCIQGIAYSRQEDGGLLNGTFELSYYYVNGNHNEYVAPSFTSYIKGTDNIFQSSAINIVDLQEEAEDSEAVEVE